jgi:hypothetical protein
MGDIYETARQGIAPPTQAPTQAPTAPQGKAPDAKRAHMILMALLPLAAKQGGQTAVTGLLHGYQQAMARQQGLARQGMLDDRQLEQQQFTRSIQQGQLDRQYAAEDRMTARDDQAEADRKLGLQQQFLSKVAESMGREDLTPEEAAAQLAAFQQSAGNYGLQPSQITAFAPPPSRLEQRRLKGILARVDSAYKDRLAPEDVDKLVPEGAEGQTVGQIRARLSGLGQQPTGQAPSKANVGSFEDYVVRRFGSSPTADQVTQARKDYMQADDRPRITVNAGSAPRTDTRVDRIVSSFNSHPLVKEFNEVQAQAAIIDRVVSGPWSGPGDMATIFAFMKALDPSSVVRETEYENARKSGNIFAGWAARFNGAINEGGGFLSDRVRRDFLRTIQSRLGVKREQYNNLRKQTSARVDRIRAGAAETGDEALVDYGSAIPETPAAPPPSTGPAIGERRTINGQLGEWDGKGWKAVSAPRPVKSH